MLFKRHLSNTKTTYTVSKPRSLMVLQVNSKLTLLKFPIMKKALLLSFHKMLKYYDFYTLYMLNLRGTLKMF